MITLSGVELRRGTRRLLHQANLTVHAGQCVGLVGANGCGKSSLLALLRGKLSADAGDVSLPKGWRIGHVAQETPALEKPALEYVIDGDHEYRKLQDQLAAAEAELAQSGGDNPKAAGRIGALHEQLAAIDGYAVHARAGELLHGLGFGRDQHLSPVSSFSGGWRMRLNLAQALISRADLLLLDEPTNHLDLDAVIWLERWLANFSGTTLLISHDRDFLDGVVGRIVAMGNEQLDSYSGNYSSYERQKAERLAQQHAAFTRQQRERAHLQSYIDRFRAKATKARQAQSRIKALEKMELLAPAHADSPFEFEFKQPEQLPNPLIQMEKVAIGYNDGEPVLSQVKLNLVPGSRIGLLGRNGAGKSTLIKLLSGSLSPMQGQYAVAGTLKVGYFAQHQLETLRPQDSPVEQLARLAPDATEQQLRDYLGGFGFHGDQALSACGSFSGGEKARLVLALMVWQKPALLLLDEPTNHLDLEMRHALTIALQGFEGAIVLVSHDRHLLRSTCEEFYLVSAGQVAPFDGTLDDYRQWLGEQKREAAAELKRPQGEAQAAPGHSAQARKEQKRREAELRKQTAPLRKQQTKLEQQMEKLDSKLADIEQQLTDNSLYQAENKGQLTELLKQQAELRGEHEEAEMCWLEIASELEALEAG